MSNSMTPTNPPDSEWLAQQLSELLSSIAIEGPPGRPGSGPGPIDPFGTKFEQLFSREATGCVNSRSEDREGLKKALLGIQKTWDPKTGMATPANPPKPKEVAAELTWIDAKHHSQEEAAMVFATTIEVHGNPMIKYLELNAEKTAPSN